MPLALLLFLAYQTDPNPSTIGLDGRTLVFAYGAAAPFAALCLVMTYLLWKKTNAQDLVITGLREAQLNREKEYLQRFAPLVLDGARLYKEGNDNVATAAERIKATEESRIDALVSSIDRLTKSMSEGTTPDGNSHG